MPLPLFFLKKVEDNVLRRRGALRVRDLLDNSEQQDDIWGVLGAVHIGHLATEAIVL